MVGAIREEESEKKLLLALCSETCYTIMSLDSISVSQILLAACQKNLPKVWRAICGLATAGKPSKKNRSRAKFTTFH